MVSSRISLLRLGCLGLATLLASAPAAAPRHGQDKAGKGYRQPARNGWIFVHLEGDAGEVGFQHGSLLAREIAELKRVIALSLEHDTGKDWNFYRKAAEEVLWPRIEDEYRQELQGIVSGVQSHGQSLDVWDITALNGWLELGPYYAPWFDKQRGEVDPHIPVPERCSAFIATGSYTADGRIAIAHNAWTGYMEGSRWNIIFDIVPARGHRILMDGMAGLIHSGDDFGVNGAGMVITETTISQFAGFDPAGVAEFVRARKAMQYASSIDEFARIMSEGNNGGYANNWLVGDNKTGEIASLELGLKNVTLRRTRDGYFAGSNFPVNPKLASQETTFPMDDNSVSANARRIRWDQLMAEHRGRIALPEAQRFLGDTFDSFSGRKDPGERTLCGRIDLSSRGLVPWMPPHGPAGAVQNKAATAVQLDRLSFTAAMGPQCGEPFNAAAHLLRHPGSGWTKPYLRDLARRPWTLFQATPRMTR